MLTIDGSMGEGGGQVLRSALSLSLLTSTPFRITGIRAGRARPGLMRQHLAAVNAAVEIADAEVLGAQIGTTELTFRPGSVRGGTYSFAIGSAGSTTLVFQTLLLPLLLGTRTPSVLTFEGGTHNPMAPPFDFIEQVFLPLLARMGARVEVGITRHGFYPAGGGRWSATLQPQLERLAPLELLERGELRARRALALVANLPHSVALRELDALCSGLGWPRESCRPSIIQNSRGPGNVLLAIVESAHVTEIVSGFGERGVAAEQVAAGVARATERYLASNAPVGEYLADQLLLPLALGAGGVFRTVKPSQHFLTQLELLERFIGIRAKITQEAADRWRIEINPR